MRCPHTATFALAAAALCACGRVDVVGSLPGADGEAPAGAVTVAALGCAEAPRVFDQALCACEDIVSAGNLVARVPGGAAPLAHVRAGGVVEMSGLAGPLEGDLVAAGGGLSLVSAEEGRIDGALRADGELGVDGELRVGGDAWLQAPMVGDGALVVDGDLYAPGERTDAAAIRVGGERWPAEAPGPVPCGCQPRETLDVYGWVAAVRDGGAPALDATGLDPATAVEVALVLPEGRAYLETLQHGGDVVLRVEGQTTLWLRRLRVDGALRAEISPGASLSIFVAREAEVAGALQLGVDADGPIGRLYVGGAMSLPSYARGSAPWSAHLYAPRLDLTFTGAASMHGSLYVRSLSSTGALELLHDPTVRDALEVCDAL